MSDGFALFSGTANVELAAAIARRLGAPLGAATVERFPDGELTVRLGESVRGKDVYIVQPTAPPVNEHLIELLTFADACRRSAARRITAIVPYFGYARADKRTGGREPITASLVASLLQAAGVDHVVTVDLHTPQVEGFFRIPVDTLTAMPTLCRALQARPRQLVVVAPDAGRVRMATEYAQRLEAGLAVLHKRRTGASETRVTYLVGEVRDRQCLIVDDIISTGGTLAESARVLLAAGADPHLAVAATHGLLVANARQRLEQAGVRELWLADTVALPVSDWPALHVASVAPLIAAAIQRLLDGDSLSDLF